MLLECLEEFPTYEQYYNHMVQHEIGQCIEFVEGVLLFDKNLLDRQEKLYIYNATSLCNELDNQVGRFMKLHELNACPIIMENEKALLDRLYKDAHSGTDSKTLEIFSRIFGDVEKNEKTILHSVRKKTKGKQKATLEKIERIRRFCNAIATGGAPKEDIYVKNKRLAAAGWSNQK